MGTMPETYETHAKGIRIVPGQWRPHYQCEHIAWISPPWPSQDYIWLDFPEAVFTSEGLLFLSHVNPACPTVFEGLGPVPWQTTPEGISYARELPDGVVFSGHVRKKDDVSVALELSIANGSRRCMREIRIQTCAYLRAIKEFAGFTAGNKYVHVPEVGWIPFDEAQTMQPERGRFSLGWRGGPKLADLPVMVTRSASAERLVAFTWYEHTYSLIENFQHPCMHADPALPDLEPGQEAGIHGELLFFEGALTEFEDWFRARQKS